MLGAFNWNCTYNRMITNCSQQFAELPQSQNQLINWFNFWNWLFCLKIEIFQSKNVSEMNWSLSILKERTTPMHCVSISQFEHCIVCVWAAYGVFLCAQFHYYSLNINIYRHKRNILLILLIFITEIRNTLYLWYTFLINFSLLLHGFHSPFFQFIIYPFFIQQEWFCIVFD